MLDFIVKYLFGGALLCAAAAEQMMRSGEGEHAVTENPNNLGYTLEKKNPRVTVPDYVPDDIFSL